MIWGYPLRGSSISIRCGTFRLQRGALPGRRVVAVTAALSQRRGGCFFGPMPRGQGLGISADRSPGFSWRDMGWCMGMMVIFHVILISVFLWCMMGMMNYVYENVDDVEMILFWLMILCLYLWSLWLENGMGRMVGLTGLPHDAVTLKKGLHQNQSPGGFMAYPEACWNDQFPNFWIEF